MKTTLLLPLLSGLLLVGCSRSGTEKTTASSDLNADTSKSAATSATVAPTASQSTVAASSTTTSNPPAVDNSPPPTVSVTVPPPKAAEEMPAASSDGVATAPSDVVAPITAAASPDSPASASAATFDAKIAEWKLTAEDITEDIKKSDRIERTKETSEAGAPTGAMETGTVTNVVAAKFLADADIAPLKFGVMITDSTAILTGSAQSPAQIGRAMALALDTDGVSKVVSRIKLETPATP